MNGSSDHNRNIRSADNRINRSNSNSYNGRHPYGNNPPDGDNNPNRIRTPDVSSHRYGNNMQNGSHCPYGSNARNGDSSSYGDNMQNGSHRPYGSNARNGDSSSYGDNMQNGSHRPYGSNARNGDSSGYGDNMQNGSHRPYGSNAQHGSGTSYRNNSQIGNSRNARNTGSGKYRDTDFQSEVCYGIQSRIPQDYQSRPGNSVRRRSKKKKTVPVLISVILILLMSVAAFFAWEYFSTELEKRSHPLIYTEYVENCSREYGVPEELIYAVIRTESSFDSNAVSHRGAVGLMQLMPETYEWLTSKMDIEYIPDLISDPEINIRCGTFYLAMLYNEFAEWDTVLAAYNAGHNRVRQWLKDESLSENGKLANIPFEETAAYVVKVNKAMEVYRRLYEM